MSLPIIVLGVEYPSQAAAARALKVPPHRIAQARRLGILDDLRVQEPTASSISAAPGALSEMAEWRRKAVRGDRKHLAALRAAHPELDPARVR